MSLPRSVVICGIKIRVQVCRSIVDSDGASLLGCFYRDLRLIQIDENCDNPHQVLFHEAIHAALSYSGANIGLTTDKEEQIVTAIEYGLSGLLKQCF